MIEYDTQPQQPEINRNAGYLRIERATTWEQVEAAAMVAKACIAPERGNWDEARRTWMAFSGEPNPRVIYYLISALSSNGPVLQGYLRLLRVSLSRIAGQYTTWVLDYCSPFHYRIIAEVRKQLNQPILVKNPGADDMILSEHWPRITLAVPVLDYYPYHNQGSQESVWMVVL